MYQVELVWNREFHFVPYGDAKESLKEAVNYAIILKNMGDGARVKKAQVLDADTGDILVENHELYNYKEKLKNN